MSDELTRRELMQIAAAAPAAARHRHESPREVAAPKPSFLKPHEMKTLARLADLILPPDGDSPAGSAGGAAEYIDVLAGGSAELAATVTGGLAWLDAEMQQRHTTGFLAATPEQQASMLDLLAYAKNHTPELAPGVGFFKWVRTLVVDAFYTSRAGVADLGFQGNGALLKFTVPEKTLRLALERSGLE
jgi:hypothetical protein